MADKEWWLISDQEPEDGQDCWISDGEDVAFATYLSGGNWHPHGIFILEDDEFPWWMPADVPKPPRSTSPAAS